MLAAVLGTCLAGTIVTHGIAAPTFVIIAPIETWAHERKRRDEDQKNKLDDQINALRGRASRRSRRK